MKKILTYLFIFSIAVFGCQSKEKKVTLILGAYTIPKEVYQEKIIPAFQKYWYEKTGQHVEFEESYIASGSQSRAIAAGFEADIAALSLEQDINRLKDAGLITSNWKNHQYHGFVTRSVVVIVFRPGNPKNIKDWEDLTREDIIVLYPNPETSGGARWDVSAIYGAGLKLSEIKSGMPDKDYAKQLLKSIQRHVKVMNKSGRASMINFDENKIGDALVTYETDVILRKKKGREVEYIIPEATILIENPIAILDKNVEKHQNRAVAEAFVQFVLSKESQRAFAEYGFRPVDKEIAAEFTQPYPQPEYLFDINYLGGWETVDKTIFGADGVWTQIVEEIAQSPGIPGVPGAVARRIDFYWGEAKKDETGKYIGRYVTIKGQGFKEHQRVIITVMGDKYNDVVGADGTFSESPDLIIPPEKKITVDVDGTTGSDKCPGTDKQLIK